jgi:hypothetical protein
MIDSINEAVARKIQERAERGHAKYGVTMDRTDLTARERMEHAQAELLDGAVYLEKCIRLNGDCEWRNIGFNDRATGCDQGITLGASTEPPTFCPFCGRRIVYPEVEKP